MLNELANDGVYLSKHEIKISFINSLLEKWLTFSQGLRNANHTQTLDLADIYGRFVYEDNLIQRRITKKILKMKLIKGPSEVYLKDLDIEFHERALLANSKRHFAKDCFSKTFEPSYKSPAEPKAQNDYKAEYKRLKAKIALLEANPSSSHNPKTFQPKNKADDELTVGKNHARNGEWIDITMKKVNILLSIDEDADWQNYLKYNNIDLKFVEEQRLNLVSTRPMWLFSDTIGNPMLYHWLDKRGIDPRAYMDRFRIKGHDERHEDAPEGLKASYHHYK
ncbi:hypothetical protein Tco_0588572 [Tanacetum coccineum]